MSKKVYRTSRGREIDMDQLRMANENVIAVGNMKTNARGDQLGKGGQVVKKRGEVVQQQNNTSANSAAKRSR